MINNNIYIIINHIIILNSFIQYLKIPNTQIPKIPTSQLFLRKYAFLDNIVYAFVTDSPAPGVL